MRWPRCECAMDSFISDPSAIEPNPSAHRLKKWRRVRCCWTGDSSRTGFIRLFAGYCLIEVQQDARRLRSTRRVASGRACYQARVANDSRRFHWRRVEGCAFFVQQIEQTLPSHPAWACVKGTGGRHSPCERRQSSGLPSEMRDGQSLGEFMMGFVVKQCERLKWSVRAQPAGAGAEAISAVEDHERRMWSGAPEVGVHAAPVSVGAGARFPFALGLDRGSSRRRVAVGRRSGRRSWDSSNRSW